MTARVAHWFGCVLALAGCSEVLGFEQPRRAPDAGTGGAAQAMACSTHRDCNDARWDGPYICRNGACLDLTTESCPIVLGREHLDDGLEPLVFGGFSRTDYPQPLSHEVTLNYDLALKDFQRSGGLLVGDRPMLPLMVVCDGLPDSAAALDASIDHLVDTVSVPGIVAPLEQSELVRSFERVRLEEQRRVLFVSPYGSDSLVTELEDEGLLWHLLGGPEEVGRAYAPLVERIETKLRAQPEIVAPLRLALVTSPDDRFLDDLGAYLRTHLTINGKPLLMQTGAEYLALALPSEVGEPNTDFSFAVQRLRDFRPHLIVSAAGKAFSTEVLPVLEQSWSAVAEGQPPPFYVLSPRQNDPRALAALLSQYRSVRARLVGVNVAAAADPTLYQLYLDRFRGEYPEATGYEGTENFYDAAYWLFYAAVAGGAAPPLDGSSLGLGMTRLASGPRFDVGPTDIANASRWLRGEPNRSISLYGTLGPPDFDLEHGTRRGTGSVWCFDPDLHVRFDVLRFDEVSGQLVGTFPCFDL